MVGRSTAAAELRAPKRYGIASTPANTHCRGGSPVFSRPHAGLLSRSVGNSGGATFNRRAGEVSFWGTGDSEVREKAGLGGLQAKLQALGVAGVVAYGLLNTLYYSTTFCFVWLYVAKVPRGLGAAEAARQFLQVMGLVWAGSQITKVPRAAGALLLAPLADHGLVAVQRYMKLKTKHQAFLTVVGVCLTLALVVFGGAVLAWA